MGKLVNWIFSQTRIGKLIDGRKTEIGFTLYAIGVILAGATTLAFDAASAFPNTQAIASAAGYLSQVEVLFSSILQDVGALGIGIGVWHDNSKRKLASS